MIIPKFESQRLQTVRDSTIDVLGFGFYFASFAWISGSTIIGTIELIASSVLFGLATAIAVMAIVKVTSFFIDYDEFSTTISVLNAAAYPHFYQP